jgi:hypothetical protein
MQCGTYKYQTMSLKESMACDLFEPMWTDSGICGVFNAQPFREVYNTSVPTNDMFTKAYGVGSVNKVGQILLGKCGPVCLKS